MKEIPKNLFEYQEILARKRSLEGRLAKVEAERASVTDEIYLKVREEYLSKLSEVDKELATIQEDMREYRDSLTTELKAVQDKAETFKKKLEEIAFRHRVGEFGEEKQLELETPIRDEMKRMIVRRGELEKALEQIGGRRKEDKQAPSFAPEEKKTAPSAQGPDAAAASPAPVKDEKEQMSQVGSEKWESLADIGEDTATGTRPARQAQATETVEPPGKEKPPPPQEKATTVEPKAGGPESEAPAKQDEWLSNYYDAPKNGAPAPASAERLQDDDDPLSALADPDEEASAKPVEEVKEKPAKPAKPVKSLPSLVITSGPANGKKIPLLPMTMTIGREHDNNIELKDEEVARYHARITHQKGEFLLEDMESSTGTWVNGKKITKVKLKTGDKIKLGTTEMSLES